MKLEPGAHGVFKQHSYSPSLSFYLCRCLEFLLRGSFSVSIIIKTHRLATMRRVAHILLLLFWGPCWHNVMVVEHEGEDLGLVGIWVPGEHRILLVAMASPTR